MVTIMLENKQVATVRMLYTVEFDFGKKCTWSKMTRVVSMCVDCYSYWWGLISSMFLRSYFTKFLFTFESNWDYTLYFHFLFRQTYSLSLCQSAQLGAYNCNIWCDVLAGFALSHLFSICFRPNLFQLAKNKPHVLAKEFGDKDSQPKRQKR